MKKKLSVRVLCSLLLTLVFFCMPMGAFVVNNSNTMSARAEEIGDTGESTEETLEATKEMTEDATIKDTQDVVEGDTEESGEIMGKRVLTKREKEIFDLLISNKTTKEIAKKLSISEKTVRNHISHVMQKLGVKGRACAVIELIKLKEISL